MKTTCTRIISLLLAMLMLFSLAACGSSDSSTPSADDSGGDETPATSTPADDVGASDTGGGGVPETLNVGTLNELGFFKVGDMASSTSYIGAKLVYNYLFLYDKNSAENYSEILEDFYYEDDYTFVMKLKQGVTFSDGSQMKASDILFSLGMYASTGLSSLVGQIDFENSYCEDDYTLILKYLTTFGAGVFGVDFVVYSEAWVNENLDDMDAWTKTPMGSGPYVVAEYVTDSYIRFEKRAGYWGDASGYPDNIMLYYYSESSTMFIALETGSIDLALNIGESDYERALAGIDGIECELLSNNVNVFLCMEADDNPYLADEAVREAICYGVDWNVVAEAGLGQLSKPADSIVNSGSIFYESIGSYEYNPEYAKQLLTDAGYSDGEIVLDFISMQYDWQKNMAEAFQYYLSQIGITVNLYFYDFATVLGAWVAGETDFNFQTAEGGSLSGDPFASVGAMVSGGGAFKVTVYEDPEYNALMNKASNTLDTEARKQAYTEVAQYIYDNYLYVPICETYGAVAWRTDVIESVDFIGPIYSELTMINYAG